jgi:protein ImuB
MTLADVRARVPHVRAVEMDAAVDLHWLQCRLREAGAFTPSVALDPPHGLVLDITGAGHLFGGDAALLAQFDGLLTARGTCVRAAIGATPDMARALARFGLHRLAARATADTVRGLPIAAIEADGQTALALRRAGLRTLADVCARPSVLFTSRFGATLVEKLDRIVGKVDRRVSPVRVRAPLVFEIKCPEPVARDVEILGLIDVLAEQAAAELTARGQGGRAFVATFQRTDHVTRSIAIETGKPLRAAATIVRLFKDRLGALADPLDPGFGFDEARLVVSRAETLTEAQITLDARDAQDEAASALIDRLTARFGSAVVHRLVPCDVHLPEATQRRVGAHEARATAVEASRESEGWGRVQAVQARPLKMLAPQPIDVELEGEYPRGFFWRRLQHRLAYAQGPERIATPWRGQQGPAWMRDYWRVETDDGRRYWLFRQFTTEAASTEAGMTGKYGAWFLQGVFA